MRSYLIDSSFLQFLPKGDARCLSKVVILQIACTESINGSLKIHIT